MASISEFDYELPEDLIAQEPVERRDRSRLMVVDRTRNSIVHETFSAIERSLESGDMLTPDLGGNATTDQVTERVCALLAGSNV